MNWVQYSKRRGKMPLDSFLIGCESEQEALDRFKSKKIDDPPLEEIRNYFNPPVVDNQVNVEPAVNTVEAEPIVTKKAKATSGTADT